jgi:hypothetical protein
MADPQQQLFQYLQMLIGSGGIGNLDSSGNPEPYDLGTASQEGTLYNKQDGLIGSLLFGGTPGGSDPATFEDIVTYEPVKDFMTDPLNRYLGEGSEGSIESLIAQLIRSGQNQSKVMQALGTPPEGGVSPLESLSEEELERVTSLVGEMHSSRSDYNEWKDQVPASERDQNDEPLSRLEVRTKSPAAQKYADAGIPNPFEQWQDSDLGNIQGEAFKVQQARGNRDSSMQALQDLEKELSNAQRINTQAGRATDTTPGSNSPSPMSQPSVPTPTPAWENPIGQPKQGADGVWRSNIASQSDTVSPNAFTASVSPTAGQNARQPESGNSGRVDTTELMRQLGGARKSSDRNQERYLDAYSDKVGEQQYVNRRREIREKRGYTPHMQAMMNQMMAQRGLGQ